MDHNFISIVDFGEEIASRPFHKHSKVKLPVRPLLC